MRSASRRGCPGCGWVPGLAVALAATAFPVSLRAQTGVSDDRVSLPDGPGSLEGAGAGDSIDPNTGLMTFRVPIVLPQGYDNLTPSLELSYNSGSGSSVAGIGWNFGAPYVQRSTLRGLPEYTMEDEFEAQGSGQLVHMPGTSPRVYRARFEKAFVRWTWHGPYDGEADYWVAEYPNGQRGWFGADQGGRAVPEARESGAKGTFRYFLVDLVDRYGHRVRYAYSKPATVALLDRVQWGAFDSGTPAYEAVCRYEARTDKLSDCSPGFEWLLEDRLVGIDVTVRGQRFRSYTVDYESSSGVSRLKSVRWKGTEGGTYPIWHSFEYSSALGVGCRSVDCGRPYMEGMGSLGVSLQAGTAELVDMNGDALPDVVDSSIEGAAHRIFLSRLEPDGTHAFRLQASVNGMQSEFDFRTPAVQVLDVNGDGLVDVLNGKTGKVLLNQGTGDWAEPASILASGDWNPGFDFTTDFDLSDGELQTIRFLDYNGDRLIDIIRCRGSGLDHRTDIFRNQGGAGFERDDKVDPVGAGFDTDNLQLNDLNGDGLLDPVQVTPYAVRYRLNLGWGQWTPLEEITDFTLTEQEARDVELEDLNGDSLADLVLVSAGRIRYRLNRNGASFDPEKSITSEDVDGVIPPKADSTILFADMNGNGSSDVVWVDKNGEASYLELFPVRPNLLTGIRNGIGARVEITYGSSVQHLARDRSTGGWPNPMPIPMAVVDKTDSWDELTGVHTVVSFRYHDGFYDGKEKLFRGFARVEQESPGDDGQEGGVYSLEYDVGASDPYFAGLPLRQETRSAGRQLLVVSNGYADCTVSGVPSRETLAWPVRHVCQTSQTSEACEGLSAAQCATSVTEFGHDGYGQQTRVAALGVTAIGGGDCPPCDESGAGGSACGPGCLGDEAYLLRELVEPDTNGDVWILGLPVRERSFARAGADGGPVDDLFEESTYFYDGEPFVGLPAGRAERGGTSRVTVRADLAGRVIERGRLRRDAHGNVLESLDAMGRPDGTTHRKSWTYDEDGLRIVRSEILLEDEDGAYRLRREYDYDPLLGKVNRVTGPRLYRGDSTSDPADSTHFVHDEFARVVAIYRPGDAADSPCETYLHETGNPSRIIARSCSESGGTLDLERVRCLDGWGREYQGRTRLDDSKYQVSGFTVWNGHGSVRRMYVPWSSPSAACDAAPPKGTRLTEFSYDALGREVLARLPPVDGEDPPAVRRTVYQPLARAVYDAADAGPGSPYQDTPTTSRYNGAGDLVSVERLLSKDGQPLVHRLRYDDFGNLSGILDPSGNLRTQEFDLAGRLVRSDDPDRGHVEYAYDDVGNVLRDTDARGVSRVREYDGANRLVAEWQDGKKDSTLARLRWDVRGDCPADRCTRTTGHIALATYPLDNGSFGEDRFGYDAVGRVEYSGRVLDRHLFETWTEWRRDGHPRSSTYPSGLRVSPRFAGDGRATAVPGYIEDVGYDPEGRLATVTFANAVESRHAFDGWNRLAGWTLSGPGGNRLLDQAYSWDRTNNLIEVQDFAILDGEPSASATYRYDALYRLVGADLDAGRPGFDEVLEFAYDRADNLLTKTSSLGPSSPAHAGSLAYGGPTSGPHGLASAGDIAFEHDPAGHLVRRGDLSIEWSHAGAPSRALRGSDVVATYGHAPGGRRISLREGGHFTWNVGADFEVRDGVAITWIRLGKDRLVQVTDPGFAASILSDLAPASGSDQEIAAAPDGRITSGDAWMSAAAKSGVVALAGGVEPSSVQSLLAASAQRTLRGGVSAIRYLHPDIRGDIAVVTDESGRPVGRNLYHPFGTLRYASDESSIRGLTGEAPDRSTGLVSLGARLYDPWAGSWTAADPAFGRVTLDAAADLNQVTGPYGYCGGNPIACRDDKGLLADKAITGFVGMVVGAVAAAILETKAHSLGLTERGLLASVGKVALGALKGGWDGLSDGTRGIAGIVADAYGDYEKMKAEVAKLIEPFGSGVTVAWDNHPRMKDRWMAARASVDRGRRMGIPSAELLALEDIEDWDWAAELKEQSERAVAEEGDGGPPVVREAFQGDGSHPRSGRRSLAKKLTAWLRASKVKTITQPVR